MTTLSTALNTLPTVTPTGDHTVPVTAGGPVGKASIQAIAAIVQILITGGAGGVGASLLTGNGPPAPTDGVDGSVWINTSTWDVSKKTTGTWSVIGNIKGDQGASGSAPTLAGGTLLGNPMASPAAAQGITIGAGLAMNGTTLSATGGGGSGGGGAAPGGVDGQIQVKMGNALAGVSVSGDATMSSSGVLTVARTGGIPFAASATTDTTDASTITRGTLSTARLPIATGSTIGGVKAGPGTSIDTDGAISAQAATSSGIAAALGYTPADVAATNVTPQAGAWRNAMGMAELPAVGNALVSFGNRGELTAISLDTAPVASSVSENDKLLVLQYGAGAMSAQTMGAISNFVLSRSSGTVAINGNVALNYAAHNGKKLVANQPSLISLPGAFLGDGFECEIWNRSSGDVTLGSGITPSGGSQTVGPNKSCRIISISHTTTGAGDEVRASIIGQNTSSTSVTVSTIGNQTSGVPFTVFGTLSGYVSVPQLQYKDNAGSYQDLPAGAQVSISSFNFVHPGMTTATAQTISVKDVNAASSGTSNGFNVVAASGVTIAAKAPTAQAFVPPGGISTSVTLTADLSGYSSAPTLQYSLDGGATFIPLPGTQTVTTTSASFSLTNIAGGSYSYRLQDQDGVLSNAVPFSVEDADLSGVPTGGSAGAAITGVSAALVGLGTAYAVLYTGGADQGARQSFSGQAVPALTPSSSGSYTLRLYDAATGGNLLAESGAITVGGSAITVATPTESIRAGAVLAVSGTANPAMANGDYRFDSTGTYSALGSFGMSGANWTGTAIAPSAGSHTIQVRRGDDQSITATSGSFSVIGGITGVPTAPSGATLQIAISANTSTGTMFSDAVASVQAYPGDAVNSIKESANGYIFTRSAAGSGPTLTAGLRNGLPGLVSNGLTRGLVCTNTTLLSALKTRFVTVAAVVTYDMAQYGRFITAGRIADAELNGFIISPHLGNGNIITLIRNGTGSNTLSVTATAYAGKRLILVNRMPIGLSGVIKCDGKMDATSIGGSLSLAGADNANAWDFFSLIRSKLPNGNDSNYPFVGKTYAVFVWTHPTQYATDAEVTTQISDLMNVWG